MRLDVPHLRLISPSPTAPHAIIAGWSFGLTLQHFSGRWRRGSRCSGAGPRFAGPGRGRRESPSLPIRRAAPRCRRSRGSGLCRGGSCRSIRLPGAGEGRQGRQARSRRKLSLPSRKPQAGKRRRPAERPQSRRAGGGRSADRVPACDLTGAESRGPAVRCSSRQCAQAADRALCLRERRCLTSWPTRWCGSRAATMPAPATGPISASPRSMSAPRSRSATRATPPAFSMRRPISATA